MNEGRRLYYGWWLTIGLFIIGMLGPLGRYSVAAFIPFFSTELGWSRASIGLGQSISMWMYAFFVLLAGFLIDRIGSRKTFFWWFLNGCWMDTPFSHRVTVGIISFLWHSNGVAGQHDPFGSLTSNSPQVVQ